MMEGLGLALQWCIILTVLTGDAFSVCDTTQPAERQANAVELKFYRVQTDKWNAEDNSAKVSARVADAANTYCAAHPGDCGLETCCTDAFKDLNVGVVEGYPKDDLKDMLLKIYIDLPSSLNTTGTLQCVVQTSAAEAIVGNARQGVHDDTGYWITYAGEEYHGIPINSRLNTIIIPVACAVLLAVILLAVILHFWNKKRENIARRRKIIEDRKKKTATVTPTYHKGVEKPGKTLPDQPQDKPKRKDHLYKDSFKREKDQDMKLRKSENENSAIKVDTSSPGDRHTQAFERDRGATGHDGHDGRYGHESGQYSQVNTMDSGNYQMKPIEHRQYGHITPLDRTPTVDDPPPSTERAERKKKKKKKKSRSRDRDMDPDYDTTHSYENTGYSVQDEYIE